MDVHDRIVSVRRTHQKTTALLHAIGCREPLYAAWVGHGCSVPPHWRTSLLQAVKRLRATGQHTPFGVF